MNEEKIPLVKKLHELALRGSDGEREAAQAALKKIMDKYDISLDDLDDKQECDYKFSYHGNEEKKLLNQIAYKVIGEGGHLYELRYTASNRQCRTAVNIRCTEVQRIEIECLFAFYTDLYKREKEFFIRAFIQKHKLFPRATSNSSANDTQLSREEIDKILTMADSLSDATPNKMLEYKGENI